MTMDCVLKIAVSSLTPLMSCKLCQGFLVDASVLPECGHSFCKTCIVRHCARSTVCPLPECNTYIHARPLTCLKKDTTLQTIVYKLFPEIYHNEMTRRRIYFKNNPDDMYDCNLDPLDAESTGTAETPSWLPQISVPHDTEVHLTYKYGLTAHLRDEFPALLREKEAAACRRDNLATMCDSTVSIEELKVFVTDHFRLPSSISVVILQANSVMDNPHTVADMVRFSCGTKAEKQVLKLFYILLPSTMVPRAFHELQEFIHYCFQKDITLHVPLSGRVKAPKKRGEQQRRVYLPGMPRDPYAFPNDGLPEHPSHQPKTSGPFHAQPSTAAHNGVLYY
ncbi:polycomb complex protein BMI-1-like [Paramacrobiotus metropolitanus]|uniref:polycomb complex protein BMI-1-like n=1 Tax=Paramacrobiotus metropolitanus TaxID=2943436 RepID=UPI0024464447|nr:polycomb complex protein BMI-1-like [Paramacrobiotus metropolitanus]XP_055349745.1 polycomb complex protein BMI-1-like [Paramacrobiotus metropolitanus]